MLVGANGQRQHRVLVVRIQQRLPTLRIENEKVLFEELANNIRTRGIA